MFKFTFPDADAFRNHVMELSVLIDEATFEVSPTGIAVRVMDRSGVCLVNFGLPKAAFSEYVCDAAENVSVNLVEFLKVLKRGSSKEAVSLNRNDSVLEVRLVGRNPKTFTVPTLSELLPPNEASVKADFVVHALATVAGLTESVDDALTVDQVVYFVAEVDQLLLSARGDLMSAAVSLVKGGDTLLEYEAKSAVKCGYSLLFLAEIVKAAKANFDLVNVEYGVGTPVKLEFKSSSVEAVKAAKLVYYLAPRLDDLE